MSIEYKAELYKREAKFFFEIIKKNIKKNFIILDVGAGPGYLVEKLILNGYKKSYGIDKVSKGFSENFIIQKKYLKKVKVKKNFFFTTIDRFKLKKKFDIILLFSVVEHVQNWESLILNCFSKLKNNGKIIVNCPNYSSFYEPHFGLPIIINKKITYYIFKKKIKFIENKKNYKGMYKELNFMTYNQLIYFLNKNKLNYKFDKNIFFKYFTRIEKDKIFAKRHPYLSKIVNFIKIIKFSKLFFYLPIRIQPILQFEISKNSLKNKS